VGQVGFRSFTVTGDMLQQRGAWDEDYWERVVGVGLNEAFKDPPVFLLFGRSDSAASAQRALEGIDSKYPGTAKVGSRLRFHASGRASADLGGAHACPGQIGGLATSGSSVRLFMRSSPGAAVESVDDGLLGLALVGDIRSLVFVCQGGLQLGTSAFALAGVSPEADGTGTRVLALEGGTSPRQAVEAALRVREGGGSRAPRRRRPRLDGPFPWLCRRFRRRNWGW
jgi:hypothetical protein